MLPPWKPERSVRARTEPRPGLLFRIEGRTRTQSSPLSLTIASCRFLSAYTFFRSSGKITLSAIKPPCPALPTAPVPASLPAPISRGETRREDRPGFDTAHGRALRGREKSTLSERATLFP